MRSSEAWVAAIPPTRLVVVQYSFAISLAGRSSVDRRHAEIATILRGVFGRPFAAALTEWERTSALPRLHGIVDRDESFVASSQILRHLPPWFRCVLINPRCRNSSVSYPRIPLAELRLLTAHGATPQDAVAALDHVVARIAWAPRSAPVRWALRERATAEDRDVEQIKRDELRAAVYLALGERKLPQIHRFGSRWLTDADGHQRAFVPQDLPVADFWQWFQDRVRNIAETSLRLEAFPLSGTRQWEQVKVPSLDSPLPAECANPYAAEDNPLDILVERERHIEAVRRWEVVIRRATPRQREILRILRETDEEGRKATLAEVASRLNLAPSTVRVQWKRLLDRVQADPQ